MEHVERELEWFLQNRRNASGGSSTDSLAYSEADGVMFSLQQEEARKAEVKVGIAYEVCARVGKDRQAYWRYKNLTCLVHESKPLERCRRYHFNESVSLLVPY